MGGTKGRLGCIKPVWEFWGHTVVVIRMKCRFRVGTIDTLGLQSSLMSKPKVIAMLLLLGGYSPGCRFRTTAGARPLHHRCMQSCTPAGVYPSDLV